MRKRYFTSHSKLPVVLLCLLAFSSFSKKKEKDTKIICFAAKNQWICAPENNQRAANDKAKSFLEKEANTSPELQTSDVVIKTFQRPNFNDFNTNQHTQNSETIIETTISEKENIVNKKVKNPNLRLNDISTYSNKWSYQLIGVSTPQSAINFVQSKNLDKNKTLIIKSSRENMEWWVVLYGIYNNKDSALSQNHTLPRNLSKPWLRSLENLNVIEVLNEY